MKIASILNCLQFDPTAIPKYHLFAGALFWTDEFPTNVAHCKEDFDCVKLLLRYRTTLNLGCPDENLRQYWELGQRLFPNWIGFRPNRVQWSDEYLRYYHEADERADREIEQWDAENDAAEGL